MTEIDLTRLYCLVDDFCKCFEGKGFWRRLESESGWKGKRGPRRRLTIPEVITLNIMRFMLHINDLKAFHRLAKEKYATEFPGMPNYENFMNATNKSSAFIALFMRFLLEENLVNSSMSEFYIDSTDVTVCLNRYIERHKVAKGYATRGKNTKGWFYGFKVQGVCDERGELKRVYFTTGNVSDGKAYEAATRGMEGLFVSDAGYLQKRDELEKMFASGRIPYCATRNNMKRLISERQFRLLMKRNCIENVWTVLKGTYNLVYHKARSVKGFFRHIFYSITSYLLSRRWMNLKFPDFFLSC